VEGSEMDCNECGARKAARAEERACIVAMLDEWCGEYSDAMEAGHPLYSRDTCMSRSQALDEAARRIEGGEDE
jgi:hypothetical protein